MVKLKLAQPRINIQDDNYPNDLRGLGDSEVLSFRALEPALFVDYIDEAVARNVAKELKLNFQYVIDNKSRKVGMFTRDLNENNPILALIRMVAGSFLIGAKDTQASCHIRNLNILQHFYSEQNGNPSILDIAAESLDEVMFTNKCLVIEENVRQLLASNTEFLGWNVVLGKEQTSYGELGAILKENEPQKSLKVKNY